jgi:hypothetical protein
MLEPEEVREAEFGKPATEEAIADSIHQLTPEPAAIDSETGTAGAEVESGNATSDTFAAVTQASATTDSAPALEAPTTTVTEAQPAMPEPVIIELVSEPPQAESGDRAAGHG